MGDDESAAPSRAAVRVGWHGEIARSVGAEPGGRRVPERVLASWQRSEDYGVPADDVEPVFSGTRDQESLFYTCGQEVLSALHRTLVNEPISLMLTDADGLVLNRLSGDTSLLRALDAVHLAPGFGYSERNAGTNGLGLALADRVPTLVRAEEHYATSLCAYTCAAAPVLDPVTGRVRGAVNLTTWSRSSSDLLLALAQSAAGNTSALMLTRSRGGDQAAYERRTRVETSRLEPGSGTVHDLGEEWARVVQEAVTAIGAGRVTLAVGEPGSGRATALAQARRRLAPRDRILSARTPPPPDVDAWLDLWSPELGKRDTGVVLSDVGALPAGAASRIRGRLRADPASASRLSLTAEHLADVPDPLADLVQTVVQVPPLRERVPDVLPLARHAARRARGRDVEISAAAVQALETCTWPGNVAQLEAAVRDAVSRTDLVEPRHLPTEVLCGSTHRLSRIETFEREEIVRVLTRPGSTMREAAEELGMSRATLYRKVAQYAVHVPRA